MRSWDHPRVCGEKSGKSRPGKAGGGSPPRMRGKGVGAAHFAGYHGITPAYAGKRQVYICVSVHRKDHPRVCGEKMVDSRITRCWGGSPPRMRGKVIRFSNVNMYKGITPAYAGKREVLSTFDRSRRDHPRVCGEKRILLHSCSRLVGSPPRMRGKEKELVEDEEINRITPAYAGKSRFNVIFRLFYRDHPRVCGEKCAPHKFGHTIEGSPPRMRGKD